VRKLADDDLAERLDRLARNRRFEQPFRVPGRLTFLAGLALFVSAAVL